MQSLLFFVLLISDFFNCPTINPLRASITNEEQRAFIKCHVLLRTMIPDFSPMLARIAGSNAIKGREVYNIYHQFEREERFTCQGAPRSGRPCTATDIDPRERLKELLDEQRCWTSDKLAYILGISKASTLSILNQLEVRKVASK